MVLNILILSGISCIIFACLLFVAGIAYKKTKGKKVIEVLNVDYKR